MSKISIRFFNDREVRAVWDDATNGWFFSVLDVVGVLNGQDDYAKNRNYWKWLKAKLKREGNQLVSATTQLRLTAADGKKYRSDMEGNGRSTRIWLDLMLKRSLRQCIDWSRVDKYAYLDAMRKSVAGSKPLTDLLRPALTTKIADRELFMKGIDYSYYYEENG